jgi:MFS superfamily sulfate permease-like transporter
MGIAALAIIFGLKKFAPKVPGVLTAVVITSVVSWLTAFEKWGGKVVGNVPAGLPSIGIPEFDMSIALDLILKAIVIVIWRISSSRFIFTFSSKYGGWRGNRICCHIYRYLSCSLFIAIAL